MKRGHGGHRGDGEHGGGREKGEDADEEKRGGGTSDGRGWDG